MIFDLICMSSLLDAAKNQISELYPCGNGVFVQVIINGSPGVVCLSTIKLREYSKILDDGTIKGSHSISNSFMSIKEANGLYNCLTEMGFYNTTPRSTVPSCVEFNQVVYPNPLPLSFGEEQVQRRHRHIRYEWNLYGQEDPKASPVNLDWGTPKNKFRQVSRSTKFPDNQIDWSWGTSLQRTRRRIDQDYHEKEPKDVILPEYFININHLWSI